VTYANEYIAIYFAGKPVACISTSLLLIQIEWVSKVFVVQWLQRKENSCKSRYISSRSIY